MFKFEDFPILKKHHLEYEKLYKWSSGASYSDEYEKRAKKFDDFIYNVYAKAIFDIFSKIKPNLYRLDVIYNWSDVFSSSFECVSNRTMEENIGDRSVLVGLVEQESSYRLPSEFYENINKDNILRAKSLLKSLKKLYSQSKMVFGKYEETLLKKF